MSSNQQGDKTVTRKRGDSGVAGDVYPDDENIHPVDPDGDPAGLAPDDTRDTEADPTPNTMTAARRVRQAGILDDYVIEEPPAKNRPVRGIDSRTAGAVDFLKAHPGKFVKVGVYSNPSSIPARLKSIDGNKVVASWTKETTVDDDGNEQETGRFLLYLKLTDQPYVKRTNRRTAQKVSNDPDSAMVAEGSDQSPADQSNEAKSEG